MSWVLSAVVWIQDTSRGRVLIGPAGFAWWNTRRVFTVAFPAPTRNLLKAYREHSKSDRIASYPTAEVTLPAVYRFVRKGLVPAQGRMA